jgi:hypothetical protein
MGWANMGTAAFYGCLTRYVEYIYIPLLDKLNIVFATWREYETYRKRDIRPE